MLSLRWDVVLQILMHTLETLQTRFVSSKRKNGFLWQRLCQVSYTPKYWQRNIFPAAGRRYTVRLHYSKSDKRVSKRKTFLPLFCQFKSWMIPVKWLRLLSLCISITEGHLPIHLLDSLIDRHVFYYLVQSFCTSAAAKNILIGNETPPDWSKSFCPRKQRIAVSMIHHILPMSIDNYLLPSSPNKYTGCDLLCWQVKPSYFGQPCYLNPFINLSKSIASLLACFYHSCEKTFPEAYLSWIKLSPNFELTY